MEKKRLYMIGNSHIDPVWFWNWDEGMQEVKATFTSALDRLREFPDVKFTSTSTAFFQWVERTAPHLFQEIKRRVAEGRWEITGGWFIEPDCILPCGEAMVRQGLYGQRYLKDRFGIMARSGSNVDSFGHGPTIPMILKGCGMEEYIFMRPYSGTPVFLWESGDGSRVHCINLPSQYTTWFFEPTKIAMETATKAMDTSPVSSMPCCYGVGNHGGGPTIENIRAVEQLKDAIEDCLVSFGTFGEFFDAVYEEKAELPLKKQSFEHVNEGCYSIDARLKRMNRKTEKRLQDTDMLLAMRAGMKGQWSDEAAEMERLWKVLLFNQFHDTLGGTCIKEARDEGIMQVSGVCAQCRNIKALMIQDMAGLTDTRGRGFPLFLINTAGVPYEGPVHVELNWFCKDPLTVFDPCGREVAYQRVHTRVKVRNYNIGGRRAIVFKARIPAAGFAVYRTEILTPQLASRDDFSLEETDAYVMENQYIRAEFDRKTGMICGLLEKETGYQALGKPAFLQMWEDQRDCWGGLMEGRRFAPTEEYYELQSIEKVESGSERQCVRVVFRFMENRLEQRYYLCRDEREITVENQLLWNREWHLLKWCLPLSEKVHTTKAECAYGVIERAEILPEKEYFMHRFLDVCSENGRGLALANQSRYSFGIEDGNLGIVIARSSIYAQGNGENWYNPLETYEYTDIGKTEFTFVLAPHGRAMDAAGWYRIAKKAEGAYEYFVDNCHEGTYKIREFSLMNTDNQNVRPAIVKKAEDDQCFVVRCQEISGSSQEFSLCFMGEIYKLSIEGSQVLTYKIDTAKKKIQAVTMLEW